MKIKILNAPCGIISALFLLVATIGQSHAAVIYAAHYSANTIERFDSVTGADLGTFASDLGGPVGIAFDNSGNLYVSGYQDGTISKITPEGVASTFTVGLNNPYHLAFDSSGNLYSADQGGATISLTTPDGTTSLWASGLDGLVAGLAFDSAGNLYASRHYVGGVGGSILKFDPSGNSLGTFATGFEYYPQSIAFDSADNLYVGQLFGDIMKITPEGSISSFSSRMAFGIAFDVTGELIIANSDSSTLVVIPSSGGDGTFLANSGSGFTYGIAIAPVPEPTSALLLLGSGAMLLQRRRRAATQASPSEV